MRAPRWWGRSPGNRTIALVAGVALATLVIGLVLGRLIVSPAQAAADAAKLLAAEVAALRPVQDVELPALEARLRELGAPLPAGRLP